MSGEGGLPQYTYMYEYLHDMPVCAAMHRVPVCSNQDRLSDRDGVEIGLLSVLRLLVTPPGR